MWQGKTTNRAKEKKGPREKNEGEQRVIFLEKSQDHKKGESTFAVNHIVKRVHWRT